MGIPSRIVEADDKEAFQISSTENIQRKSLNPVEKAYAFEAYNLNYGWGFGFVGFGILTISSYMIILGLYSTAILHLPRCQT